MILLLDDLLEEFIVDDHAAATPTKIVMLLRTLLRMGLLLRRLNTSIIPASRCQIEERVVQGCTERVVMMVMIILLMMLQMLLAI